MNDAEALKKIAGEAACDFVKTGMRVGLGTGSTVKYTVLELGRRIKEEGLDIVGVPTSVATQELALEVGIPLVELGSLDGLDIVIDGTDEFDPQFQLIKGGGAALLREKIVAQQSASMVVVADDRKQVDCLGAFGIPIEITPFSCDVTISVLSKLLNCELNSVSTAVNMSSPTMAIVSQMQRLGQRLLNLSKQSRRFSMLLVWSKLVCSTTCAMRSSWPVLVV